MIPPPTRRITEPVAAARAVRGLVCPRCDGRFDEGPTAPATCPMDGALLLRATDVIAANNDPMLGRTLGGRFTLLSKLGAGSMGTVYRARQHAMQRDVAIKILRTDRAAFDDTVKARFLREAHANSILASPHTVTVFDFGEEPSGELYLAMELLEGESVGARLKRMGRLRFDEAADVARQALRSLAEAHEKGIIHRDLKPDNLFFAKVGHEEIVKVLDFGIAKVLYDNKSMNPLETQDGQVFGTPRYMSPEQAQGKPIDARTDLYSLGVILYQMLAGRAPFTDDDAIVVMARHIKTTPPKPSEVCAEASIPTDIEDVVMRVLSKDPNQRPSSADELAVILARALEIGMGSTSGVRISGSPSKMPYASVTSSRPPQVHEGSLSSPPPPVDVPITEETGASRAAPAPASGRLDDSKGTLGAHHDPSGSIAPVIARPSPRRRAAVTAGAIGVVGIVVLWLAFGRGAFAPAPNVTREAAGTAPAAAPVAAPPNASVSAPAEPAAPAAAAPAPAHPGDLEFGEATSADVAETESSPPTGKPGDRRPNGRGAPPSHGRRPSVRAGAAAPNAGATPAAPSASASTHYGLFD